MFAPACAVQWGDGKSVEGCTGLVPVHDRP